MAQIATITDHTVAVYATHQEAHEAIKLLNESGYEMKQLSIIGQDYATEEHPVGFINTGDRMWSWGKLGAFWGAMWGLLFGGAMMAVPGVGFIFLAGWIVSALETGAVVGGLAAIGGALSGIGVPKDSVVDYQTALKAGSFLVVAHGTQAETDRAKAALTTTLAIRLDSYAAKPLVEAL